MQEITRKRVESCVEKDLRPSKSEVILLIGANDGLSTVKFRL
jgi:hypothetical protein